jgi:adenosine kinase
VRIAVTGSIATDHLMAFPGRFSEQLLADQLRTVSLSFLVDSLDIRRGGVAPNICFGLGALGLRPVLVGAAGRDFDPYGDWLRDHGVDTVGVHLSETLHTARFLCTTDTDQNQIASFYPGAMAEARDIALSSVVRRAGGIDLVLIGADDPEAMLRHTDGCRTLGLPFAADPSQQLARMTGADIRRLVDGAAYLFGNEYEHELLVKHTGWTEDEILGRVGLWITTMGDRGVSVQSATRPPFAVPAVPVGRLAEPTGGGGAFRAGFLAATAWGLAPERAAQLGCLLAAHAVETVGTQAYQIDRTPFLRRFAEAYGQSAAADIDTCWRTTHDES